MTITTTVQFKRPTDFIWAGIKKWNRARKSKYYRIIAESEFFDEKWYRTHYEDILDGDPIKDYLRRASELQRDPGPNFSTAQYLQRFPYLVATGQNPLVHFLTEGQRYTSPRGKVTSPAKEERGGRSNRLVVACIAGESTGGRMYRVERFAEAVRDAGHSAWSISIEEVRLRATDLASADIIFIWRAPWHELTAEIFEIAKRSNAPVVFDCDDLIVNPAHAVPEIVDGIRSNGDQEEDTRSAYRLIQQTLLNANFAMGTTEALAKEMRKLGRPTFVLPDGFDSDVLTASMAAARAREREPRDGLIRIGYAIGNKTHQCDFRQAASAVAAIMKKYPETRLVLFYQQDRSQLLDVSEFPEIEALADRIEWRTFVPIDELPKELARFDISIVPLEVGNVFCEAKSELKFCEAALVGVPTIASPTDPFARAIRHGENGLLAASHTDWFESLEHLVTDPALRRQLARSAKHFCLWHYGPRRRAQLVKNILDQVSGDAAVAAQAFELANYRACKKIQEIDVPDSDIVFTSDAGRNAEVTVVIPLYNYASFVEETLNSAAGQSLDDLDLVIVDDCSTDNSLAVAHRWLERNFSRFNRVMLLKNRKNGGLGLARNVGFDASQSAYIMALDADNILRPRCCEDLLDAIKSDRAAFAYSHLRQFGDKSGLMGVKPFHPQNMVIGNYIDAMALIAKDAWAAVGGYGSDRMGWQDYELWCRFIDMGFWGVQVPKVLADYRVHGSSMLTSGTISYENRVERAETMNAAHPWLRLVPPPPQNGNAPAKIG